MLPPLTGTVLLSTTTRPSLSLLCTITPLPTAKSLTHAGRACYTDAQDSGNRNEMTQVVKGVIILAVKRIVLRQCKQLLILHDWQLALHR